MITFVWARIRHAPLRSAATLLGVAAVALLAALGLHLHRAGAALATSQPGEPLVALQVGRICPSTSVLPWNISDQIAAVPGVQLVQAQQVVINDCKLSTTATTFRGVDVEQFSQQTLPRLEVLSGDVSSWGAERALVGSQVAAARKLQVGDQLESAGVAVTVAAIIRGERMQDRASVWVDYRHLSQAVPALANSATLFEIQPAPGVHGETLAQHIDAALNHATHTAPFSATAARLTGSLAETLRTGALIAAAALGAGLLLLFNSSFLSLRTAGRDLGVLRAIGHAPSRLATWSAFEGALLGGVGGICGIIAAVLLLQQSALAISAEGIAVVVDHHWGLLLVVAVLSVAAGVVASGLPAWWAARAALRQVLVGQS